jgi:hypothetical protein
VSGQGNRHTPCAEAGGIRSVPATKSDGVYAIVRRRLRAPTLDGAALLEPPLATEIQVLLDNRSRLLSSEPTILGQSLAAQANSARIELVRLARSYTADYRDIPSPPQPDSQTPLILAGHQPQLFHPGVWFKHFVLSELANRAGAQAINLVIDNDVAGPAAIKVPSGSLAEPVLESVPYDGPDREIPFEERAILDEACFESFGARASATIAPLVARPLVRELWPLACAAARRTGSLGRALAEARHKLEGQWGLNTLEVPLSLVCDTDSFRTFAARLLADLPGLREVHNSSLAEYRRVNKIRSRSHPVPKLAAEGDYLEAPFWLWTRDHPRRRRLFARRVGKKLEVTDRDRVTFDLSLVPDTDLSAAGEQLRALAERGIKLRPRALITTAYARLFLADLFVHGIGGAKYDQLTDAILARFFGVEPPPFAFATATLRLPIERPQETSADLVKLEETLRQLRFHPERFVSESSGEFGQLIGEKRRLVATEPLPELRRARHLRIEAINAELRAAVTEIHKNLLEEQGRLEKRVRAGGLLGSREFSFCLFPGEYVREKLGRLS